MARKCPAKKTFLTHTSRRKSRYNKIVRNKISISQWFGNKYVCGFSKWGTSDYNILNRIGWNKQRGKEGKIVRSMCTMCANRNGSLQISKCRHPIEVEKCGKSPMSDWFSTYILEIQKCYYIHTFNRWCLSFSKKRKTICEIPFFDLADLQESGEYISMDRTVYIVGF